MDFKKFPKKIKQLLLGRKEIIVLILLIGLFVINPKPAATQSTTVDLLEWYLRTDGNPMSSGEVFRAVPEGSGFRMCKSADCAGYELFGYDSNYIYFIMDTTWGTGLNQPVRCLDNGNPASYRVFGEHNITCENYSGRPPGQWAPRTMSLGQSHSAPTSIVGFETANLDRCCPAPYTGNSAINTTYTYRGCVIFPTGVTSPDAIILHIGQENFYLDSNHGWVGWDNGDPNGGSYTTRNLGAPPPGTSCMTISYSPGFDPGAPTGPYSSLTLTYDWPDDPGHFYVPRSGNEEVIGLLGNLEGGEATNLPSLPPYLMPTPEPPPPPPPGANILDMSNCAYLQTNSRWASEYIDACPCPHPLGVSTASLNLTCPVGTVGCGSGNGCGCGPTSGAIVLCYFNENVNPLDVARRMQNLSSSQPSYDCTRGTIFWGMATYIMQNVYGLRFESISFDQISDRISQGHPIITPCAHWGYGFGFDANHISVIKGYDNNYVYFQDPAYGERVFPAENVRTTFGCSYYAFYR